MTFGVMRSVGILLMVLGGGGAWGGLLGSWRYGHGLGGRAYRYFRWSVRWGIVAAILGLALFGFGAESD